MNLKCPLCSKVIAVADALAGQRATCPFCRQIFTVPALNVSPAAPAPAVPSSAPSPSQPAPRRQRVSVLQRIFQPRGPRQSKPRKKPAVKAVPSPAFAPTPAFQPLTPSFSPAPAPLPRTVGQGPPALWKDTKL